MSIPTEVAPYTIPADAGREAVWWKTGRVLLKAGGAETEGRLSQVELVDPLGAAPPLHLHRHEDETFFVLEGSCTMFVGDERLALVTGDYAFVSRGVVHTYLVTSERARLLVTFSPSGFEQAFLALGIPVANCDQPEDAVFPAPEEVGRALAVYGCEIVGPPPTLDDAR